MMLLTTSRKPGQLTRAVARTLASALGAEYHNRGKGGLESVLQEAEKLGASKILFVWERFGNPSRLVGFDLQKARQVNENQSERFDEPQKVDQDVFDPIKKRFTLEDKKRAARQDCEAEKEKSDGSKESDDSPWLEPEIGIHGVLFNRQLIRHKGAVFTIEDAFGKKVATLLDANKGPNEIVLSRFGLKLISDSNLVLEFKFK